MEMAYIARHSCGLIVAAAVDLPENQRATAKEVASWIRRGEAVERLEIEAVRKAEWCRCFRKTASKSRGKD